MIMIGFFTDLIMPAISPIVPPMFNIISIVWGIGFLYIVKSYKLMSVFDASSPDLILKTVMNPIIMIDSNGIIVTCNQATADLFKYNMEQIINKPLFDILKSKKFDQEKLNMLYGIKALRNVEIDLVDSFGNLINAFASFSMAESKLDGLVGMVLNIVDITNLKRIEEELIKSKEQYKDLSEHLDKIANYDKLTDLPNRRLLFDKLELAIENYKISGNKYALVFIDLDGFKLINDSYGHDIGDLLLVKISNIFITSFRKQDIVARVGGDEFVIVFSDIQHELELDNIIQRMKEMFVKPIVIMNNICPIGISLGISKCPEDGITTDELMKIADERMYKDKSSKINKLSESGQ